MQNCENDKSDHQMRKKYFQFQRNEQSEIVSELHQCFWGGLSEVWEKTKITPCFTHIQEGWQEFSRKLVTPEVYFEAVIFSAPALRGSPHSSHNQLLLWDEQACLYLGPKVNFLFSDRDFCWWNKWPLYPGLQLSHRNYPQKIFRFRARGHFLGLTPVFGRFWPFPL